jgi:hypothetical protein
MGMSRADQRAKLDKSREGCFQKPEAWRAASRPFAGMRLFISGGTAFAWQSWGSAPRWPGICPEVRGASSGLGAGALRWLSALSRRIRAGKQSLKYAIGDQ